MNGFSSTRFASGTDFRPIDLSNDMLFIVIQEPDRERKPRYLPIPLDTPFGFEFGSSESNNWTFSASIFWGIHVEFFHIHAGFPSVADSDLEPIDSCNGVLLLRVQEPGMAGMVHNLEIPVNVPDEFSFDPTSLNARSFSASMPRGFRVEIIGIHTNPTSKFSQGSGFRNPTRFEQEDESD